MEWIDAKTIVANNKRINRDYLAAEYTMNIYRGCSHGCIYCFASTFTSNSRILKNEDKEMAIYISRRVVI